MGLTGGVKRQWRTAFAAWLGGVAAYQTALALGAPWGAAAWGGGHPGVLPRRLRAASAAGAVVWTGAATIAVGVAGGAASRRRVLRSTTAFAGLGVLLNAVSPSPAERAVWVPLTAVGTALGMLAVREDATS